MSLTIEQLRSLLVRSKLLDETACRRLLREFSRSQGAGSQPNAKAFATWLVTNDKLTRYQASVLMAGRAGPFFVGAYKLVERITEGRLAGTYRAVHVGTNHPVGLLFLHGPTADNAKALAQVAQQASRATALRHRHLQRCYQFVQSKSRKYIVYENLKGRSLEEKINATGALPPARACSIARQIALALSTIHATGEVHAEVRPANIWLDETGTARLVQFPLSRDPFAPPGWKSPAELAAPASDGTWPDYFAPELAAGGSMPDVSGDIYGLGCTLFQMLSATVPYPGGDVAEKLSRHAKRPVPDVRQRKNDVPPAIAKLVAFAMAKGPQDRYRDAAALVQALEPYVDPTELTALPDPATPSSQAYESWLRESKGSPVATNAASVVAAVPSQMPQATVAVPIAQQADTPVAVAIASPASPDKDGGSAETLGENTTSGVSISVPESDRRVSSYRRRRFSPLLPAIAIGTMLLIAAVAVVFFVRPVRDALFGGVDTASKDSPGPEAPGPSTNANNGPSASSTAANTSTSEPANDTGDPTAEAAGAAMWESPTAGEPIDLRFLPGAAGIVIAWRPADLLAGTEGKRILAVMGPLERLLGIDELRNSGVPLENIDQAVIAFSPGQGSEQLNASLVLRTHEPVSEDKLRAAWRNPAPETVEGVPVFTTAERAFFLPADGEGRTLVIVPVDRVAEAISAARSPAPLRRELEVLARSSDRERTFSMLIAPSFLSTAETELLNEETVAIKELLEWLLGVDVRGGLVSFHLDPQNLFLELRIAGGSLKSPPSYLKELRGRVAELAGRVESQSESVPPTSEGHNVLKRFPKMLSFLDEHTRGELDGRDVLLRAYLPSVAAHNLLLGTRLALKPGTPTAVAQTAETMSIEERLAQKVSLSFQRNTLEKAVELLAEELAVDIEILGSDLQLEGITKNQSFGLDEKDVAGKKILARILELSSPEGKLVYVIRNKPDSNEQMIAITTRAAAAKRGDKIPAELEKN